ncbi:MAG TPA: endonuclease/exonuclease/phosphatase family protein [Cyclobacteriaceae bacterium]
MIRIVALTACIFLCCMMGNAQRLTVMTYNIRLNIAIDSINQWPNRAHKVFDLIHKYNPDVLGVQEALHSQMQDLLKGLPGYMYVGVGRDDGKTKGEYSAIFLKRNRFTIEEQKTFWLSETPDVPGSKSWDAAITRVSTYTKVYDKKLKKDYFLFNTHFDHMGALAREKSAELIKTKIKDLTGDLPVILTGDFNCEKSERAYPVMIAPTGKQLYDSRPESNTQGTFCTFNVSVPCKAIDYIFYSAGWKVENYTIITDNDGKYYPSDHLPVMTEFSFTK